MAGYYAFVFGVSVGVVSKGKLNLIRFYLCMIFKVVSGMKTAAL